jgi:hypothetical protein
MLKNKWLTATIVVLCWALLTSFAAGYYYLQYSDLSSKLKGQVFLSNLGIDYGNGSGIQWFNGTRINAGSTLFDLTKLVASVNYSESLGSTFVTGINSVSNLAGKDWFWWSYSSFGWSFGTFASNKYVVGNNETLLWDYQDSSVFPPPSP